MKAGVPGKLDDEPLRPNKRDINWIFQIMPLNFDRNNLTFVVTDDAIEGEMSPRRIPSTGFLIPTRIEMLIHPNDWIKLLHEMLQAPIYFVSIQDPNATEDGALGTILGIKVYSRTRSQTQALSSSEHNRPGPTQP